MTEAELNGEDEEEAPVAFVRVAEPILEPGVRRVLPESFREGSIAVVSGRFREAEGVLDRVHRVAKEVPGDEEGEEPDENIARGKACGFEGRGRVLK